MEENLISGFNGIADEYDKNYTFSAINILQRKQVLAYVEKNVFNVKKLNILEINCGTGEDAIYFEKLGHNVLATDASIKMILAAQRKIERVKNTNIIFRQLSFSEIHNFKVEQKFDLVFSNFGGLNNISKEEMKLLFGDISMLLKNDGRFIGVLMPKFCLLEILYFLVKFQWRNMFRRNHKGPVKVNLNGIFVNVWYYSPSAIKKVNDSFHIKNFVPIGIALPPTYMEGFFKRKHVLLKMMNAIEPVLNKIPLLAGFSDHFLFDLQKVK